MDNTKGMKNAAQIQADAQRYAADKQAESTAKQLELQEKLYNQNQGWLQQQEDYNKGQADKKVELFKPALDEFYSSLKELQNAAGPDSWFTREFGADDMKNAEGYNFVLEQGNKALENSQAARGGVFSGAAVKEAQRLNQNLASQEFQNEFNRNMTQRQNRMNSLINLNQIGQYGVNGTANSMYMSNLGDKMTGLNSNYGQMLNNIYTNDADVQSNLALGGAKTQAEYEMAIANAKGNQFSNIINGAFTGASTGASTGNPYAAFGGGIAGGVMGGMGVNFNPQSNGAGQALNRA